MRQGFLKGIVCGLAAAGIAAGVCADAADDRIVYRYTVEEGDTVYAVAARMARPRDDINRLAWEICRDNGVRQGMIYPGQELVIRLHPAF